MVKAEHWFTAGRVERAMDWVSRNQQLTCPRPNSRRITLKRHVRQRLGSRAGPSLGPGTIQLLPHSRPFFSGNGEAGQSVTQKPACPPAPLAGGADAHRSFHFLAELEHHINNLRIALATGAPSSRGEVPLSHPIFPYFTSRPNKG